MENKNIIVTGGTDGIGLAIVKNLLNENNKNFIIGNNTQKGERILKLLNNNKVNFLQCNLLEKNEIINYLRNFLN